jgi:uncharacterized BrkB/YihY/UPF0761 family membrane protein
MRETLGLFIKRVPYELMASFFISTIPIIYVATISSEKEAVINLANNFVINQAVLLYFLVGLFVFLLTAVVRYLFNNTIISLLYNAFKLVGEVMISTYRIAGGALLGLLVVWYFVEPESINLKRVTLTVVLAIASSLTGALLAAFQISIDNKFDKVYQSRLNT